MYRTILRTALVALVLAIGLAHVSTADEPLRPRRPLLQRVFPYGFHTPHPDNPYYNPYTNVRYWYPKYYGGIHYRDFHRQAYPTGDYPIRGTAW